MFVKVNLLVVGLASSTFSNQKRLKYFLHNDKHHEYDNNNEDTLMSFYNLSKNQNQKKCLLKDSK